MNPNGQSIDALAHDPIPRAVIKNAVPAMIAMMRVMIYNIADIFFVGLTHDDLQVAAVSLASPVFMVFMSIGALFGVGGTSVVSRAMGAGKADYAKKVCAFCFWTSVGVGLVLMAALWLGLERVTVLLGASRETLAHTERYLGITVSCGVFSMISNCFSNLLRAEGKAMKAMTGTVVGNLLNIILDPIFILALDWGVMGAAVATVIGTVVSAAYYLIYFFRGKSTLSIRLRDYTPKDGILSGVISVGLSASLANLLVSISMMVTNSMLAEYGDLYVAGYGVTSKVMMLVSLIAIGLGSGVQPLFGYCIGAGNRERLMGSLRFATVFALGLCLLLSLLCFLLAGPIIQIFLTNEEAYLAGKQFTRILLSSAWLIGAFIVFQNCLQAMGAAVPALLASLLRQGVIYVPALLIMRALLGMEGLIWAQPVAEVLALLLLAFMLRRRLKRLDI